MILNESLSLEDNLKNFLNTYITAAVNNYNGHEKRHCHNFEMEFWFNVLSVFNSCIDEAYFQNQFEKNDFFFSDFLNTGNVEELT